MAGACWLEQWETRWQCCSDLLSYCSAMIHLFNGDELENSVFPSCFSHPLFYTINKHKLCWMSCCFFLITEEKKLLQSGQGSSLWLSLHWQYWLPATSWDRQMADVHLLKFVPFLFPFNRFQVKAGLKHSPACTGTATGATCLSNKYLTCNPVKWQKELRHQFSYGFC